jgi:hypothetical protein
MMRKYLVQCQTLTVPYFHDNVKSTDRSSPKTIKELITLMSVPRQLREIYSDERPTIDYIFQLNKDSRKNTTSKILQRSIVDAFANLIKSNKSTLRVFYLNINETNNMEHLLSFIMPCPCPLLTRFKFGYYSSILPIIPLTLMQTQCPNLTALECDNRHFFETPISLGILMIVCTFIVNVYVACALYFVYDI